MGSLPLATLKEIKMLVSQTKKLEKSIETILSSTGPDHAKYGSYKDMAIFYNGLAERAQCVMQTGFFYFFNTKDMQSWANTVWPFQKNVLESVLVNTGLLISSLESNIDFIDDEIDNVENFIRTKLRSAIFSVPTKEKEIQNGIENLFVGRGYLKGIDYDRETGKFKYSGREYIPDFIMPKFRLCIEVKLLAESARKSKLIEEINADIPAYGKEYEKLLFIVYDVGVIRDELEFCRDIGNNDGVKIVVIKH